MNEITAIETEASLLPEWFKDLLLDLRLHLNNDEALKNLQAKNLIIFKDVKTKIDGCAYLNLLSSDQLKVFATKVNANVNGSNTDTMAYSINWETFVKKSEDMLDDDC